MLLLWTINFVSIVLAGHGVKATENLITTLSLISVKVAERESAP